MSARLASRKRPVVVLGPLLALLQGCGERVQIGAALVPCSGAPCGGTCMMAEPCDPGPCEPPRMGHCDMMGHCVDTPICPDPTCLGKPCGAPCWHCPPDNPGCSEPPSPQD